MMIKTVPSMQVICYSTRTTMKGLSAFAGKMAMQLYAEASRQQLLPAGPVYWLYEGADGKPDTEFSLDIALPVNGRPQHESKFAFRELPPFECVASTHVGAWDHLFETYDRVIDSVFQKGRQLNGSCRESYIYMDFSEPAHNITEVQMGVI